MKQLSSKKRAMLTQSNGKQNGFSLIEVLITAIIISFGVLGLISLQLSELRNTRSALVNSQATLLIADITERVRANATQFNAYATLDAKNNDCKTKACTAGDLVASDLYSWQTRLAATLPSGEGEISADDDTLTISIHWDESNNGAVGKNCPPISAEDLSCLGVTISI